MPTRRKPQTNPQRFKALKAGKDRKDMVPAPAIIPYTGPTIIRIDTFYPVYKGKIDAGDAALIGQATTTTLVKTSRRMAELFISHFYQALQNAIARDTFTAEIRPGYGLAVNDSNIPILNSEADIDFWGGKINTGETARVAGGGVPITFPSLAEVNTAVGNFNTANLLQANAKEAYDTAQEEMEVQNPEADLLILKMWNETESTFDVGNKPSLRRKCREWGVIYVPIPGELPSPAEFSIMGKVKVEGAGSTAAIEEATITVVETGATTLSLANGDFFVDLLTPGTYTLLVEKANFAPKTIPGVIVTAGALTSMNIFLTPSGAVEGTVLQGGMPVPATITIAGTTLSTTTDPLGNYYITNIPAGARTIRATKNGSMPPLFIEQNVMVTQGSALSVHFVFA